MRDKSFVLTNAHYTFQSLIVKKVNNELQDQLNSEQYSGSIVLEIFQEKYQLYLELLFKTLKSVLNNTPMIYLFS
jgi:hypothetical protein